MKIADVNEFYSTRGGGVRTYVDQKLDASAAAGLKTYIIAPGPEDKREPRKGGEVIWVKSPPLPLDSRYHIFWRSNAVHAVLNELRPEMVEASSTWRGAWIAAKWRGEAQKSLFLHQDPVAVYPHSFLSPAIREDVVDRMCFWFWSYLRNLSSNF